MAEYVTVITTTDSEDSAGALGRGIVDARLAACVQISGPIRSIYRWREAVEDDQEWRLMIKTTAAAVPALQEHIIANHGYDTPEVVVLPITGGSAAYLAWVGEETSPAAPTG